jgi:hypothetical protein
MVRPLLESAAYPQVTDADVISKESLSFSFIEPPNNTDV